MRWKIVGLILFAIIIATFTIINSTLVKVNLFFYQVETNLILIILISVLLGIALMAILWSIRDWKIKKETGQLKQRIAELEGPTSSIPNTSPSTMPEEGEEIQTPQPETPETDPLSR